MLKISLKNNICSDLPPEYHSLTAKIWHFTITPHNFNSQTDTVCLFGETVKQLITFDTLSALIQISNSNSGLNFNDLT